MVKVTASSFCIVDISNNYISFITFLYELIKIWQNLLFGASIDKVSRDIMLSAIYLKFYHSCDVAVAC